MKKLLFAILVLLGSHYMLVAQPKADLYRLQQKYPDQPALFTDVTEEIVINQVDGKLYIKMKIDKESMLLDDRAALYDEGRVSYSSLVSLSAIEASTLYPGEKRYKEIKVEEFKEKDRLGSSVFHDDIKEKKFSYPSLVKGAKRRLFIEYDIKDPYLLSSYQIQEYWPVEKSTLKIVCPADMEIGYKVFNGDSVNISYETKIEKGKAIHTWHTADIKPLESEAGSPGHLYYSPHIVYYIKSYNANGKKQKVIESVDDLHGYYSNLIKDVNKDTYTPLKKLADSLTTNLKTEEEKIKTVFYWVKDNIRYIAFESGYAGFIPAEAKDVYETRYGDCKGMSSIITTMLKYAGVTSYLTWIGSRELPYKYNDNPTSGSDDHMIAAVKLNGQYVFLDATSRNTPFGYPTAFIQGKEAIIHLAHDKYEVVTVPVLPASKNVIIDSSVVEITSDYKLTGKGQGYYTGYERNEMLEMLDDNTHADNIAVLKNYFQKGNNKFILESYEESDMKDRDRPFTINYKFNVSDYVLRSGNEIFINMNLEKPFGKSNVEKDRENDIEYDYKRHLTNIVVLKIPAGYELSYLPPNDSQTKDEYSYSIKYEKQGDTIILRTDVELNSLMLKKKDFKAWNDFINALKKNYTESVALKAR
ncbi:MAG TPA: transglutaminase-like domain-containing protein [Chitinophagales bacterium]|nr:transglutaminase-like domain-containing protein [Chitinophagales bacterium]